MVPASNALCHTFRFYHFYQDSVCGDQLYKIGMHLDMYRLCSIEIMILGCSYYNLKNLLTLDQFIALEYISVPHRTRKSPIHNININYNIIDIPRQYQNIKQHLQSKQVKRSSHEWIKFNNFIIANSISGIISIIWLLDE